MKQLWQALLLNISSLQQRLMLGEKVARWVRRFEALSLRERSLLVAAVTFSLLAGWHGLVMQSIYAREKLAIATLQNLAPNGENVTSDVDQLVVQEQKLGAEYAGNRQQLEVRAAGLVDAGRMAVLLTDLIASRQGVRLVRIANLPEEELRAAESAVVADGDAQVVDTSSASTDPNANSTPNAPAVAFMHGIEIELEGDFGSIDNYLATVERAPWRLLWRRLELDASEYPKLRARLVVATLSLDRQWLSL